MSRLDEIAAGFTWATSAWPTPGVVFSELDSRTRILVVSDKYVDCNTCMAQDIKTRMCSTLPACVGMGFVKDTRKNRARLAVAALNGERLG